METLHEKTAYFRRALRDHLSAQEDALVQFLRLVAATPVPADAQRVVIALYSDDLTDAFPARLAYVTADDLETRGTEGWSRLVSRLQSFGPLCDVNALSEIAEWETDLAGEVRAAPTQPWDGIDIAAEYMAPVFSAAAARTDLSALPVPLHLALVASGKVEVLSRPSGPDRPGLLQRLMARRVAKD